MSAIKTETLTAENELVRESVKEVLGVVKSGEGTFVAGQCFKFDSGTMKLVKTTTGAGFVRVALEAGDATSADVMINMLAEGTVNGFKLVGVDYIVSDNEMSTPDAPVTELVSGGTLTAATHEYKAAATNDNGSTTVSAASTAVTTHVATAGFVTGNTYATYGAINTALGDCTVTPKVVTLRIDGVIASYSFTADYTGAGAFASYAAFAAAMVFAGAVTATPSASTPIKVTSSTTGATSTVVVVSDTSGLFSTKVETSGLPIEKTVKITLPEVAGATGFRLWRSIGGGTYTYRDVTAAEFAQGYVLDNGGLTWAAGTAITATDFATLQLAENHSLFVEEVTSGYNFRS